MVTPRGYLVERTTFERAADENTVDGIPFGYANEAWQRLLAMRREGDVLWRFQPPDEMAIQLWGYALVRGGEIVSTVKYRPAHRRKRNQPLPEENQEAEQPRESNWQPWVRDAVNLLYAALVIALLVYVALLVVGLLRAS